MTCFIFTYGLNCLQADHGLSSWLPTFSIFFLVSLHKIRAFKPWKLNDYFRCFESRADAVSFPFTENRILLRASSYCYVDNECNVGCLWQLLECRMCFSEPNKKPFSLVCQPSTWRLQLGDSTSVCLCLYAIRVRRCVLMVIFFGRKYTSYPYKKIKFCQVRLCKRQCSYISENKLSPSV